MTITLEHCHIARGWSALRSNEYRTHVIRLDYQWLYGLTAAQNNLLRDPIGSNTPDIPSHQSSNWSLMMPRLFAGIEIPSSISTMLSLQKGGLHGARWINEANYHITLHYMGDVDYDLANEIAFQMSQIQLPEFDLSLHGFGSFGSKNPHSVFAAVKTCEDLTLLHQDITSRMRRLGLKSDKHDYTPHVTLARLNKSAAPIDVANYLALHGNFRTQDFTVPRFVLYSSRDSIGGGPYVVEETFDLL
ncbi:RNA 2',3'-cyclic phosphodiesterase [Cohaesibacter celericrescens]|nr:RNA 2',3'-cyclic phosphodiesterase [Cohaesibacter celericrescens]